MNLQAQKLEVLKLILDTDDKKIISEVKALFKRQPKPLTADLENFYEGFRNGIQEVKQSLEGKSEMKDADNWLNELQD